MKNEMKSNLDYFEGPLLNMEWNPTDQEIIDFAIDYRNGDHKEADDVQGEPVVERLLLLLKKTMKVNAESIAALVAAEKAFWEASRGSDMTVADFDNQDLMVKINDAIYDAQEVNNLIAPVEYGLKTCPE